MTNLFRQGALQGTKPGDAFFIRCDETTTTQDDIHSGVFNIIVGFAPLKPAEFVLIRIQQLAGQTNVSATRGAGVGIKPGVERSEAPGTPREK